MSFEFAFQYQIEGKRLFAIYEKVIQAKIMAVNKENFISILKKQGIQADWNDSKVIRFTDNSGSQISNNQLSEIFKKNFNKEALTAEFQDNAQLRENFKLSSFLNSAEEVTKFLKYAPVKEAHGQILPAENLVHSQIKNTVGSWLINIHIKAKIAKELAVNPENFINIAARMNIKVSWDDKKEITFTDNLGHTVTASLLNQTFNINFSKETLINEFKRTAQSIAAAGKLERTLLDGTAEKPASDERERSSGTEDNAAFIRKTRAEIADARTAERASTKERNHKISERAHRDSVRSRQYFRGERSTQTGNGKNKGRSRERDFSR